MKVEELIGNLQKLNPDYDITVGGLEICWISTEKDILNKEFYSIDI